ncbi:MAG: PKD domain-containing protein [Candidatus Bathyarchaeia archaeon]
MYPYGPLDNYDFNGDGNQDIVTTKGIYGYDVIVWLGNGDGTFTCSNTYGGGTGYYRHAISAPPYIQNKKPVAEADGPYMGFEGSSVTFSGAVSLDPDGTIVGYDWDLDGDGLYDDASGVTASYTW